MRQLIWLIMSPSALTTTLFGVWATGVSLTPLRRMCGVAARASANPLTTCSDASRTLEELRGLAGELNAMLVRLEETFQRLSALSVDITHELCTPLTSLLTQTQMVLSRPRPLEDYRKALHGSLEELERLIAMINDVLLLIRADHDPLASNRQTSNLGAEVDSLLESYQLLAEDHDICLLREGSLNLPDDHGMLRRVLTNLSDSILCPTADDGGIHIRLGDRRLSIEDQGPATPPERLSRLFNRFYRADPACRGGQGEYAGLGLAICRSIVQAYDGEIRYEPADGQIRLVIDFARLRQ